MDLNAQLFVGCDENFSLNNEPKQELRSRDSPEMENYANMFCHCDASETKQKREGERRATRIADNSAFMLPAGLQVRCIASREPFERF